MNSNYFFRNVALGAGLLLIMLTPAFAHSAARVALVIGNAGYTDAPDLPQAKNDAQGMANALEQLGFQVILALDADKRGMDDAVKRFGKQIENGGVALLYYSGHGLQEDGINYLIPLASGITKKADIQYQAVSANWILASMEEWNEQGVNIMILDACRNPFKMKGGAEGLAPMESAGSLVAYATAANKRAGIEPGATFSLYTQQLLNVLQTNPCQKIADLFLEVGELVEKGTERGQTPYLSLSPSVRRFQFAECAAAPTPAPTPQIVYIEVTPQPTSTPLRVPTRKPANTPTPRPSTPLRVTSCWENETPGATCAEATTGMAFVYVPGGCFQMGQTETEKQQLLTEVSQEDYNTYYADELPRHQVCLDGFWMGKYEVTNAQYRRFKADHDSQSYDGKSLNGDTQPVVMVNWHEAIAFTEWLTKKNRGQGAFRLPTEAEWEYAARAGATTARFWGDDPKHAQACAYANVHDQTSKKAFKDFTWPEHQCSDGYAVTAPVGSFRPNDFGLYDMLGNVWEWCQDAYASYSDTPTDGSASGSLGDEKANRLLRGGSWFDLPSVVRGADRYRNEPDNQIVNVGLRVVRVR